MDWPVNLFQKLLRRIFAVHLWIGRIIKLTGHKNIRVICCHIICHPLAFVDTVSDIPRIMHEDDLSPIMLHQHSPLFGNRIRHNDLYLISLYRSTKCKADALVAAGRLYDHGSPRRDKLFLLCIFQHVQSSPRLDRAAHIQTLKFDKYFCAAFRDHMI